MKVRFVVMVAVVLAVGVLGGCAAAPSSPPEPASPPATDAPLGGDSSSGIRLAPGLYDLEDGTAQALGTLDYSDLEGGFWQVLDSTQAENAGAVVAVIANGADFSSQLEPLKGAFVSVKGTKLDGASVRMAGPEIEMTSVEEIVDMQGPAE